MGKTITAVFVAAVTDREGAFFAVRDRSHKDLMQERSPTVKGLFSRSETAPTKTPCRSGL
jgi:hypothetical protein